jgi:hypothetical protein
MLKIKIVLQSCSHYLETRISFPCIWLNIYQTENFFQIKVVNPNGIYTFVIHNLQYDKPFLRKNMTDIILVTPYSFIFF